MSKHQLRVDFGSITGKIKPLHGINLGPLSFCGLFDFSEDYKKLRIPSTRLHDCPYTIPGTVDIHCLFPLFHADEHDPKNYVFPISDDYLQAIVDAGSDIVFRLGETIEHHKRNKYFIHPPENFDKWAEICVQVIRHYNEGWANGFNHGIRYWEIWNEPWSLCWTGTPEQFYHLYETAAKRIKKHDNKLLVGSGGTEEWNDFIDGFVKHCRKTETPIDFLVWHMYRHHPCEIAEISREMRARLDEAGFPDAEIHLNEWAHNPDRCFAYLNARSGKGVELQKRLQGAPGGTFTATILAWLQDLPVDVANYYWGREGVWGLFDPQGMPTKIYSAFEAFVEVLKLENRAETEGTIEKDGVAILASVSKETNEAAVLATNFESENTGFELKLDNLPWQGATEISKRVLDDENALACVETKRVEAGNAILHESIAAPSACLFKLKKVN